MNRKVRSLVLAAVCVALGLVLPFLTGQIPSIGSKLSPMHIPVLLCGFLCGWQYGLAAGFVLPLLRNLLFGMPPAAALAPILIKSVLLALAAGYAATHFRKISLPLLCGVVLFYQVVGTLFEWAIAGSFFAAVQDFRLGIPGMLLQIVGGYAIIRYALKK